MSQTLARPTPRAASFQSRNESPTRKRARLRRRGTVEAAVLDGDASQPRLKAPVTTDVQAFLQKHLYSDRLQRMPAATQASLKASGGKFGAAVNFSSAPTRAGASIQIGKQRKKKRKPESKALAGGGHSTLEQMAAKIMRRKQS
jgi:hypothetical protein